MNKLEFEESVNHHTVTFGKIMKLKQLAYRKIKNFGISYSKSIKYLDWKEKEIYLILWCNKFLMFSTHEENFKTLHGLSELKNKNELINFLKSLNWFKYFLLIIKKFYTKILKTIL